MGRTVGIVQARMTSTRLPGKILKPLCSVPLLQFELQRLMRVSCLDELVVATTTNSDDEPVVDLCDRIGVPVFRGSEHDVLDRFYRTAASFRAETIVRFTADCPLIDPLWVQGVIERYLEGDCDYVGIDYNSMPRGMDSEVCSFATLQMAHVEGASRPDREHVTWFIWNNPTRFKICRVGSAEDWSSYRLTVDTQEDYQLILQLIDRLTDQSDEFTLEDIVLLLQKQPHLLDINASIEQKKS